VRNEKVEHGVDVEEKIDSITCIFVGNSHDFSDHAIDLATISVGSVKFRRMGKIEDLLSCKFDRPDRVRSIILNQSMAHNLIDIIDDLQNRFPNATTALAFRQPELARMVLTQMSRQRPAGGFAFLPMNRDMDRWLTVLRLLICGENFIPSDLYDFSAQNVDAEPTYDGSEDAFAAPCKMPDGKHNRPTNGASRVRLTMREAEVLSCVAEGKQNKLIANRLGLSEHTVKLHIHHVIAKLGVHNRTEAAVWFLENQGGAQVTQ
jgi:DNA-binding NarL/FixJ family response regulator